MLYDWDSWKAAEREPVQLTASNGTKIPLELPDPSEEEVRYHGDMGVCTYPLDCCAMTLRPCNRCPHLERFWP